MKLSGDKTSLAIELDGTLNADQVDELLRRLTLLRAQMEPGLTRNLDAQIAGPVPPLTQGDAPLTMGALRDGSFMVWGYNSGLGWLGFGANRLTAITLRDLLVKHLGATGGGPNLLEQDGRPTLLN